MRDKLIGWAIIAGFLAGLGFIALRSNSPEQWGDQIVHAQGDTLPRADCYAEGRATATGLQIANGGFNNLGTTSDHNVPCTNWHLVYFSNGASAVTIGIQTAADANGVPGSFSYPQPISGANPAVAIGNGQLSVSTYYPWINVNVGSLTAKGAVTWRLLGWRPGPNSDVNAPSINGGTVAASINSVTLSAGPGTTELVAGIAGVQMHIYNIQIVDANQMAGTIKFIEGTGALCAGGSPGPLTPNFVFNVPANGNDANLIIPWVNRPLTTQGPGDNLCMVTTGMTVSVGVELSQP